MDIENNNSSKVIPYKVEEGEYHKLSWENLFWEIDIKSMNPFHQNKIKKKILDNVCGEVASKQFLAIMGPSGCGKTSLLDLLANRSSSGELSGKILIDGEKMPPNFYASYVAQEDSLLGSFTTKETLMYTAALTLNYKHGYQERLDTVSRLILDLGLESCADTKVGDIFFKGISGGQKRRLSLGIGLISNPSILLLDEPTSGLDAASAFEVIQLLTNLCITKGLCIAATIHQPSSDIYALFNKLMLLSAGKLIYFGNADEAVGYFSSIGYTCPDEFNPADFFLGLINTDFPNHIDISLLQVTFRSKMLNFIDSTEIPSRNYKIFSYQNPNPSVWHAIVLTHRFFLNSIRNPGIIGVRIAMYTMLGVAIGGVFYKTGDKSTNSAIQGTIGCLFYIFAFLIFMSVAVIPFYIMDRVTYQREQFNGDYKAFAFVAANFIASIPGIFLIALFSTIPIVLLMKLKNFDWFLLLLFLSLICSEGLMAVVSAVSPHFIIGIAASAGLFGFFMLCEGFFQIKSQIPGWFIWVYYMGFHTYALRGAIVNEFGSRGILTDSTNPLWKTGHDVLVYMNMNNVQKGDDAWTLLGYAFAWHLVYYFIVRNQTGKRKTS